MRTFVWVKFLASLVNIPVLANVTHGKVLFLRKAIPRSATLYTAVLGVVVARHIVG